MPSVIQAGSILIADSSLMGQLQGVESEPYSGTWNLVKALDSVALDRKIRASGWHFFFMAGVVKAMFFGAPGVKKIQNALTKILGKVRQEHFNALEVTEIVAKHFLGVPYAIVRAHSRHIQQGSYLESNEVRRTSQRNAIWARG